jgi:putative ABC transport system ATP-binding protein
MSIVRPMIQLENVTKTYWMGEQKVPVLKGVSLNVGEGEFVAVMGPSGSGKSTLMNILGCLDVPTTGRYVLDGVDVTDRDADALARTRNTTIGFVFQQFNLLARTTAVENVELPLLYAGVPAQVRRQRAEEALSRVGLSERFEHQPHQLSGGQQQRVALARALVGRPRLLFADEPTGNLDSENSVAIMAMLQELERDGMTIVLVTHEAEISGYAARTITLRDGVVAADSRRRARTVGVLRNEETTA